MPRSLAALHAVYVFSCASFLLALLLLLAIPQSVESADANKIHVPAWHPKTQALFKSGNVFAGYAGHPLVHNMGKDPRQPNPHHPRPPEPATC